MCLCVCVLKASALKNRLKKSSNTVGDGAARAFLKSQAALFGSYRSALRIEPVKHTRCNNDDSRVCQLADSFFQLTKRTKVFE